VSFIPKCHIVMILTVQLLEYLQDMTLTEKSQLILILPSLMTIMLSWRFGSITLTRYYHVSHHFRPLHRFLCLICLTLGKPRSFVYQIPLNKDGIPILPHIDASEATASQLAQLLDEYLLSLWSTYGNCAILFLSQLNFPSFFRIRRLG